MKLMRIFIVLPLLFIALGVFMVDWNQPANQPGNPQIHRMRGEEFAASLPQALAEDEYVSADGLGHFLRREHQTARTHDGLLSGLRMERLPRDTFMFLLFCGLLAGAVLVLVRKEKLLVKLCLPAFCAIMVFSMILSASCAPGRSLDYLGDYEFYPLTVDGVDGARKLSGGVQVLARFRRNYGTEIEPDYVFYLSDGTFVHSGGKESALLKRQAGEKQNG